MKRLLIALALLLCPALAQAQCNGVFPNNTLCGNISGKGNLPRPVSNSALTGVPGGTNGQIQYNNNGNFGGLTFSGDVTGTTSGALTIQPGVVTTGKIATNGVSNINLAPGPANTIKGSLNGTTTSDIAIASCSAIYNFTQWLSGTGWQCGINLVIPSRAVAATLNLSAFTSVVTLGWSTPGDGGGAQFKNIGTTQAFIDTYPLTFTLANAGSGCTPGTYSNAFVTYTGAVAFGSWGRVTIGGGGTFSSGAVTTPGVGFNVGDTASNLGITGCSVQPAFAAATISTPTGSFTDTASNRWQILLRPDNAVNVLAFGAKADWSPSCTDACATNNTLPIQSAFWFAYAQGQQTVSGFNGTLGARVDLPPKTLMSCALTLPQGVTMAGAGRYSTTLKDCDAELAANHFITVGDAVLQLACFGSMIRDIALSPGAQTNGASASTAIVFSNCIQQQTFMERVVASGGLRSSVNLQIGYGGAEGLGIHDLEAGGSGTTNSPIIMNYEGNIDMNHIVVETGLNLAVAGLSITGGNVNLENFHSEGYQSPIFLNVPSNAGFSSFHHIGCGANAVNCITRQAGSATNVNIAGFVQGGSTSALNNAGSTTSSPIIADQLF